MNAIEYRTFTERLIRCAVYLVAAAVLIALCGACATFKQLPADGVIAAGSSAGAVGATAVGGPVGLGIWGAAVIVSIWAAETYVRPDPITSAIPNGGSADLPPWYLSPDYWWALIFVTLAGVFLVKLLISARFRGHIRDGLRCLYQRKFKAALAYFLAAGGIVHTSVPSSLDESGDSQKPQAPE